MFKQIAGDWLRHHGGAPGEKMRMAAWTRAGVREMEKHVWIQEPSRLG